MAASALTWTANRAVQPRNLILSFATAAAPADLRRFISSAREACDAASTDIVLFVDPAPVAFANLARRLSVQLIPATTFWREIRDNLKLKIFFRGAIRTLRVLEGGVAYRSVAQHWLHPQAGRYLFFEEYLRANPQYAQVMLSDSRDVIFQADPFPLVADPVLHLFEQDPSLKFGGDNVDTQWLSRLYGRSGLAQLVGKQTYCSGTTFAPVPVMMQYLEAMTAEILRQPTVPLDQAMHNKIVHEEWGVERSRSHPNLSGPVLTMHGVPPEAFDLREGRVYVGERLVPVLHQYDRFDAVKAAVHDRLADAERILNV